MIAFLSGKILSKSENEAVLDVQGVGYEVRLNTNDLIDLGEVGDDVRIHVYTHYTENSLQLFGFLKNESKLIFKKLISVSGVGPKLGLTVLGGLPLPQLIQSLVVGDVATLTKISGVGKKTAERMITELKDKFKDVAMDFNQASQNSTSITRKPLHVDSRVYDATQALVSLGYSEMMAKKALANVDLLENDTIQSLIKKSLGVLAQ